MFGMSASIALCTIRCRSRSRWPVKFSETTVMKKLDPHPLDVSSTWTNNGASAVDACNDSSIFSALTMISPRRSKPGPLAQPERRSFGYDGEVLRCGCVVAKPIAAPVPSYSALASLPSMMPRRWRAAALHPDLGLVLLVRSGHFEEARNCQGIFVEPVAHTPLMRFAIWSP